jgi:hypothetical protein
MKKKKNDRKRERKKKIEKENLSKKKIYWPPNTFEESGVDEIDCQWQPSTSVYIYTDTLAYRRQKKKKTKKKKERRRLQITRHEVWVALRERLETT